MACLLLGAIGVSAPTAVSAESGPDVPAAIAVLADERTATSSPSPTEFPDDDLPAGVTEDLLPPPPEDGLHELAPLPLSGDLEADEDENGLTVAGGIALGVAVSVLALGAVGMYFVVRRPTDD